MITEESGVSVVLCCLNSAGRLPTVLQHVAAQQTRTNLRWEVVVVDNGSVDGTADVAERTWEVLASVAPLRVVGEPQRGLSYARRRGVLESRYSVVVFCDDDNVLSSDYVDLAFDVMRTYPDVGVAGGRSAPHVEGPLPRWFHEVAGHYAVGEQARASGDVTFSRGYLWGAGMVVRAAVLRHLYRIGWPVLLDDRAGTHMSSGGDAEICKWFIAGCWTLRYDERLRFGHIIPAERLSPSYVRAQGDGFVEAERVLREYNRCVHRDRVRSTHPLLSRARIRAEAAVILRSRPFARHWNQLRGELADAGLSRCAPTGSYRSSAI